MRLGFEVRGYIFAYRHYSEVFRGNFGSIVSLFACTILEIGSMQVRLATEVAFMGYV